jgi:hypothetical protein
MALALNAREDRGGSWGHQFQPTMSDPYAEEERVIREEIDRLNQSVQLNTNRSVSRTDPRIDEENDFNNGTSSLSS